MLQRFHFQEKRNNCPCHVPSAGFCSKKKMYATGINATRYENDETIVILDSETAYNPNLDKSEKFNINTLTSMMIKQVRAHDRKGIALLSDLGKFILNNRIADLISYELSMPVRSDSNVRPFCFYHKDDFNVLQEEERIRICCHHTNNSVVS